MSTHKAQPVIRGRIVACRECGGQVYRRTYAKVENGVKVWRPRWTHLGYRNTTGLRHSLMERSGGFYEGENFGTGKRETA